MRELTGIRRVLFRYPDSYLRPPPEFRASVAALVARLDKSRVTRRETSVPPEGLRYYYARKIYAAAKSEEQRDDKGKVLVWLDEDSVR